MESAFDVGATVWRAVFEIRASSDIARRQALCAQRKRPVGIARQVLSWSRDALRCDFLQGAGSAAPQASLLVRQGMAPTLMWHSARRCTPLPAPWRRAPLPVTVSSDEYTGDFGRVDAERLLWTFAKPRGEVLARIEWLADGPTPFGLAAWWQLVMPALGPGNGRRGLPLAIELSGNDGSMVELRLLDRARSFRSDAGWADVPAGYAMVEAPPMRSKIDRSRNDARLERLQGSRQTGGAFDTQARVDRLFSGGARELLKVVVPGGYLGPWIETFRRATGYFGTFNGENFRFRTDHWADDVLENAPWPRPAPARSVFPMLLIRAALLMLSEALHALKLKDHNDDLETAVAAIPDPARKRAWEAFIRRCDRERLRPVLEDFLRDNPVTRLGALDELPPDANLVLALLELLAVLNPLLQDLGAARPLIRQNPQARLALAWLAQRLPEVSIAPDLPSSRTRGNATVYYSTVRRDITIELRVDELDLTLNIDLFDWKHTIDFGRQPILRPFVFADAARLQALRAVVPRLSRLADLQFGYETALDLSRFALDADVDIQPEASAGTVLLGLFCPPCLAALFAAGSASASLADASWPIGVAAAQSDIGLDAPRLRAVLGEPTFGDVDVSVALFSLNPFVLLAGDVVANIIGDDVLEGVLQAVSPAVEPILDQVLERVPLPHPADIVTAGTRSRAPSPTLTLRHRDVPLDYLVELAETDDSPAGGPLTYPPEGAEPRFDIGVLMSDRFVARSIPSPGLQTTSFQTGKADGSVGDVDWWSEPPDLTDMPPRPGLVVQPPPTLSLVSGNVGQSYWVYSTVISIMTVGKSLRDLADAAPIDPIGDLLLEVEVRAEARRYEVIMYEDCEDMTRVAAGLMPETLRPGAVRPTGGRPPVAAPGSVRSGGIGWVSRRANRVPAGAGAPEVPGGAPRLPGGLDYGFFLPEELPLPDDAGPPHVPPVMVCRNVVSLAMVERQVWLEAHLRLSFPVRLGWKERHDWTKIQSIGFNFLPAFDFQFVDRSFSEDDLDFTLVSAPPLATMQLPANQAWLRELMVSRAREAVARTGALDPVPPGPSRLHHQYDTAELAELEPEDLSVRFQYEVLRHNTFIGAFQSRNLAVELQIEVPVRGRL